MGNELWILRIELQLRARGHEGKAFEQALYIGVGYFEAIHRQAPRHFRELVRKLSADLSQVCEFFVVEAKESRIH